MKTYQDIKTGAHIDAIVHYAERLLGIRLKYVKKNRYSSPCPFHADTKESFMAYVNKNDEVRFHCFGACKGDWDICDLIMLRNRYGFRQAQQIWADQLRVDDFMFDDGNSPGIPEPDETLRPDDTVGFAEPEKLDEKMIAVLSDTIDFYNDLLMSNEDRFNHIWNYLASRDVNKEAIRKFKIGYAPPYGDEQYQGRALIASFSSRFEKDESVFNAFLEAGLVRFLNDATVKKYGYYYQQIDFRQKNSYSRNYGDYFAGRIVFPIYDTDAHPMGIVGRCPEDRGIRWHKHQNREIPLSTKGWLFGIEKAEKYIRQYQTIIIAEGIFDYFTFYNLLQEQGKPVVVSTLGTYLTPEATNILKGLDIRHFIVVHDWDEVGRNKIERIAVKSGAWVYYLGGLAEGQDPYDMLKPVVLAIDGISLRPLTSDGPPATNDKETKMNDIIQDDITSPKRSPSQGDVQHKMQKNVNDKDVAVSRDKESL
jgi:DNA primase